LSVIAGGIALDRDDCCALSTAGSILRPFVLFELQTIAQRLCSFFIPELCNCAKDRVQGTGCRGQLIEPVVICIACSFLLVFGAKTERPDSQGIGPFFLLILSVAYLGLIHRKLREELFIEKKRVTK